MIWNRERVIWWERGWEGLEYVNFIMNILRVYVIIGVYIVIFVFFLW
jgi:hypothetical protein